jgi:hypothetical protein
MTIKRSGTRSSGPAAVLVLAIAMLGCSVEGPPGASGPVDPVVPASGEPLASAVTPSELPASEAPQPTEVPLPDDLRALLAQVVGYLPGSPMEHRLGTPPLDVQADPAAQTFYDIDYYATGSYVTLLTMAGEMWEIDEVDPTTGARRRITTMQRDGMLAVSRHPAGASMLVGSLGVDLVDVAGGERRQLIAPVLPPGLEGGTARDFEWSPTGRTAAATICSIEVCVVDLIDPSDWSVRRMPDPMSLHALTDEYAVFYPSDGDRRPRLLDLATLESRPVATKQLAGLISAYARDDGGFVLYGVSSWPYVYPVHRPLVHVDPVSGTDRVLVDQGPEGWAYPFMEWTSNDWVLLNPELGDGGKPGLLIAVDTRTGERYEFIIDAQGRAVAP